MRKLIYLSFFLFSILCSVIGQNQVYMFSYFTGNGEDGLHLAYSEDGLQWNALKNGESFLTPTVGEHKLMRDPSIWQGPDGVFHMVWTSSWTDRGIGYASSVDLVNWSEQKYIPVMEHEPTARNCWAPELFYDDASGLYYIFWTTTIPGRHSDISDSESEKGLNHRMYYVTTRDFNEFSSTQMFFDPEFSVIDAAIINNLFDGGYLMIVKKMKTLIRRKRICV